MFSLLIRLALFLAGSTMLLDQLAPMQLVGAM